jgi:hypothetical protein
MDADINPSEAEQLLHEVSCWLPESINNGPPAQANADHNGCPVQDTGENAICWHKLALVLFRR